MKLYLVLTKQTRPDGDFDAEVFKTHERAVEYMEEVTNKSKEEWDDEDYTVFEDADYYECVAQIIEDEL